MRGVPQRVAWDSNGGLVVGDATGKLFRVEQRVQKCSGGPGQAPKAGGRAKHNTVMRSAAAVPSGRSYRRWATDGTAPETPLDLGGASSTIYVLIFPAD